MFRVASFRRIQPFGFRGKERPTHAPVSPTPSKIPYGGFSPVRLQTSIHVRPSSVPRLIRTLLLTRPSTRILSGTWTFVPSERAGGRIRPARPVALGSATGCSVQPPRRLLWPHPRFWVPCWASFLIPSSWERFAPGFPRTSPLLSACPLVRATFHTPAIPVNSYDYSSFTMLLSSCVEGFSNRLCGSIPA